MKQMLATREKSLYNKKRYINKEKLTLVDKYIEKVNNKKVIFWKRSDHYGFINRRSCIDSTKNDCPTRQRTKDFFFDLEGQLVKMGDTLYIRYKEELLEDTEPTPVTIKIEPDGHVQLIRAGELRMRLRFGYQEKLDTSYRTPYGLLQISTFTHNLRVSLKDQPMSGKILVDYDLYSQTERIGEYHLELEFTA